MLQTFGLEFLGWKLGRLENRWEDNIKVGYKELTADKLVKDLITESV